MKIKFVIRKPLYELYWRKGADPEFTAYAKHATKFNTLEEAEKAIETEVPSGAVYVIDKCYAKF